MSSWKIPSAVKCFDHFESFTLQDNTFFGVELKFGGSHEGGDYFFSHSIKHQHNVLNTLILADQRCRVSCTESYVVEFHGKAKKAECGRSKGVLWIHRRVVEQRVCKRAVLGKQCDDGQPVWILD